MNRCSYAPTVNNSFRLRRGLLVLSGTVLCTLLLMSCTEDRHFRTERDVVAHFEKNRSLFERAVALFEQSGDGEFDASARTARTPTRNGLLQLSEATQFTKIVIVPLKGSPEEQYIQFELRGHPSAPYGLIFVPKKHGPALNSMLSDVGGPSGVLSRVRNLGGGWFYYEYD